jgi:hypothetical protein
MHTCTGRRRGIILFQWEKRPGAPGASGASWIRFETAGTAFVHIYQLLTFIIILGWMEWWNSYPAYLGSFVYTIYLIRSALLSGWTCHLPTWIWRFLTKVILTIV